MTEIEKALGPQPERKGGKLPKGWLILTGILILLNLVTLGVGWYRDGRAAKKLEDAGKQHAATMQQMKQKQDEQIIAMVTQEGESIARTFQMVNPLLLTDRGQQKALGFFSNIGSSNGYIKYIALFDAGGTMCATTNLFLGKVVIPSGINNEIVSTKGVGDVDIQFFGPITDSNGRRIGTVLIGMSFKAAKSMPLAKPNGATTEDVEPNPPATISLPSPTTREPAEMTPPPATDPQPPISEEGEEDAPGGTR